MYILYIDILNFLKSAIKNFKNMVILSTLADRLSHVGGEPQFRESATAQPAVGVASVELLIQE